MTEDEAKTKWCPFARILDGQAGNGEAAAASVNRQGPATTLNCIGSACMAWRLREIPCATNKGTRIFDGMDGYCGLSGKP